VADIDLMAGDFDPTHATIFHKPAPNAAIQAAARLPVFEEFLRFSQVPLWRVSPAPDLEGGKVVDVIDLRFGAPPDAVALASATFDANLHVTESSFQFGRSYRVEYH
jgi:hypothetical protein